MSKTRNLEDLEAQALTCIAAAYNKGYKSGLNDGNINDGTFAAKVKEAYDNGLNDAEKAVKRVLNEPSKGGLYANEMQEIFGTKGTFTIFLTYSMSEIIEKIREYDERKQQEELKKACDDEIHVGDEVYSLDSKHKYAVLGFLDNGKLFVFSGKGLTGVFALNQVHKTGRKYPVAEILEGLENGGE